MPFQPGQSGNPEGRPRVPPAFKQACRELADTALIALTEALKVSGERVPAAALIMAYGYGKPVARIEHRVIRGLGDLSEEELSALLASVDDNSGQELVH